MSYSPRLFPANFQARIEELRHSQEHIQAMNARNELEDSPNKTEQHHTQTNTAAAEINEQRPKMEEDKEEKTRNKKEEGMAKKSILYFYHLDLGLTIRPKILCKTQKL